MRTWVKHHHRKTCKIKLKKGRVPDWKFNRTQLRKGIKVEMEHTNNPMVAKQIAKAHLYESPRYYKELEKMERRL